MEASEGKQDLSWQRFGDTIMSLHISENMLHLSSSIWLSYAR